MHPTSLPSLRPCRPPDADVNKIADTTVSLDKEKAQKVMRIVERLEDLEDVQQVSTNLDLPDDYEEE